MPTQTTMIGNNAKSIFGFGCISEIGGALKSMGVCRPLICSDIIFLHFFARTLQIFGNQIHSYFFLRRISIELPKILSTLRLKEYFTMEIIDTKHCGLSRKEQSALECLKMERMLVRKEVE